MSYPPPYGPYGPVHTQVVTQPYRSSTTHVVIAWIVAVLTVGYMLPWAIAATRNKSNTAIIAVINFLLGWSLVGWIVALVMSLISEPQPAIYVNTAVLPAQRPYGPPAARALLPPSHEWNQQAHGQWQHGQGHQGQGQGNEPTAILPPVQNAPQQWHRLQDPPTYR